jgi:hypothetical protein
MKSARDAAKIVFLSILFVALSLALGACFGEPTVTIRIYNQTDETLNIFTDEIFIDSAAPGGKVYWEIDTVSQEYPIVAKDVAGDTVYAKTFTRDEMIRNKWRVVIPATAKSVEQGDNVTGR